MASIELKGVTKRFMVGGDEILALNDVDLSIESGEFIAIQGPSGSGKSTLLNIIGCIDQPTAGSIVLDGKDISKMNESQLTKVRLRKIGFIFQQFHLIPSLNAFENVELPMKEAGLSRAARRERCEELFELVDLSPRMKHFPSQLSGGEQQRVAIARALANDPILLLADEPTGELDSKNSDKIMDTLDGLNKDKGLTILLVTHDPGIAKVAHSRIAMQDGKIVKKKNKKA